MTLTEKEEEKEREQNNLAKNSVNNNIQKKYFERPAEIKDFFLQVFVLIFLHPEIRS